jgi:hypothetical protein
MMIQLVTLASGMILVLGSRMVHMLALETVVMFVVVLVQWLARWLVLEMGSLMEQSLVVVLI